MVGGCSRIILAHSWPSRHRLPLSSHTVCVPCAPPPPRARRGALTPCSPLSRRGAGAEADLGVAASGPRLRMLSKGTTGQWKGRERRPCCSQNDLAAWLSSHADPDVG